MSVDWTGQWVLRAGRRHLALQKLDENEDSSLKKYHRNSKYDVSAAEWAICENSQEYCAIATSQLIEVVTWSSGDPTLIYSLRAHTRMVTDIDWHSKEPHLLASCSIDTFTHLWDLRDPRKPILSLSAVCMSGATQVGFNRVSGNLLATAHDGDLRIWDIRKGSCPQQYITAHLARIHGINWSHNHEHYLTTASQDGTVKYFDVNNSRRAEKIITVSSPVWRARYTPAGNGLITVVVPHLGRGENSLLLWNNNKQTEPVCSFEGHTDVILDFAWRPNRDSSSTDIELITWSRDQTLRLWKIDESLLRLCDPPQQETEDEAADMQLGSWSTVKTVRKNPSSKSLTEQPSCSLQHEFSLLNTNISHIDFEVLDPIKRHALVKVSANGHMIVLEINFPSNYPSPNVPPEFIFCENSSINDSLSISLLKVLKTHALQRVKKGRTCMEQCLRALVTALKRSTGGGDKTQLRLQSPRLEGALSGTLHDACIPFPKTSGAKFNTSGLFVTFSQPLNTKRISLRRQNITPRALSAISGGYLGNVMGSQPVLYAHRDTSTSAFYIQDRHRKNFRSRSSQRASSNAVINVYDVTKLLNISKTLSEQYILDKTNIVRTCRHNKAVAETTDRPELIQAWNLAEMIASSCTPEDIVYGNLFQTNPFQRHLLNSLITHFAKHGDIQTAVMLCCTFDKFCSKPEPHQGYGHNSVSISPAHSPYHTINPVEFSNDHSWNLAMQVKQLRSNSWSDSLDWTELKQLNNEINRSTFKKCQKNLFDSFIKAYAEVLFSWGLLPARAMVLKHLSSPSDAVKGVEFPIECVFCNRVNKGPSCSNCKRLLLRCTICRIPVKGAANACLNCGHGGHTEHLKKWFETRDMCAAGCQCRCLDESQHVLNDLLQL